MRLQCMGFIYASIALVLLKVNFVNTDRNVVSSIFHKKAHHLHLGDRHTLPTNKKTQARQPGFDGRQ